MAKKAGKETQKHGPRTVATNRKAHYEYYIEETHEAGVVLTGTEIKSVRNARVNLQDGFVLIRNGEAWLLNVHIAHFEHGNRNNHEETRQRKLLLHRAQIDKLHSQATLRNWTIVPLRMYINDQGRAKVEIGLAQGKQGHDKRQTIAKRENDRELRRVLKERY